MSIFIGNFQEYTIYKRRELEKLKQKKSWKYNVSLGSCHKATPTATSFSTGWPLKN